MTKQTHHHRRATHKDTLQVFRTLLALAGQDRRGDGWRLEGRKVKHYDRGHFYAWTLDGPRTQGANPKAWTEYALGWTDANGAFEGPPGQAPQATSWERAILAWAEALTAQDPGNPDLQEARTQIGVLAVAAENARPPKIKVTQARTWLSCVFTGSKRTEIPAVEILERAAARGIAFGTLIRAKRQAGYMSRRHRSDNRSTWTWVRPKPKDPDGKDLT